METPRSKEQPLPQPFWGWKRSLPHRQKAWGAPGGLRSCGEAWAWERIQTPQFSKHRCEVGILNSSTEEETVRAPLPCSCLCLANTAAHGEPVGLDQMVSEMTGSVGWRELQFCFLIPPW